MVKAIISNKDGGKLLLLGLSRLNTKKLLEGKPIAFDITVNEATFRIAILGGETEEAIKDKLLERYPQLKDQMDSELN